MKKTINFIKIISFAFLCVSIFLVNTNESFAQTSEPFSIETQVGTQSPWNKSVPVTVKFKSNIDSEKTEISWDLPAAIKVSGSYTNYSTLKKGQVATFTANIIPVQSGTYDIVVNLTAWNNDTNYTSSNKFNVTFNDSLELTPITDSYRTAQSVKFIVIAVLIIIGLIGLFFLGKIGLKKLKIWLKPPE